MKVRTWQSGKEVTNFGSFHNQIDKEGNWGAFELNVAVSETEFNVIAEATVEKMGQKTKVIITVPGKTKSSK